MIEEELFHRALEKPTLAEQIAFLDQVCADQPEVRQRVERLLHSHRHDDSFLHPPGTTDEALAQRPGTMIGPYKLLEQIGEGGMGTVYMAEQTHPIQRKVALKIIKAGMDSKQIIARFEAERQALALMDHVNIARVFDGGMIPFQIADFRLQIGKANAEDPSSNLKSEIENLKSTGRPYFVMELVHGVPITKYCDDNHLTPRERLELFVPVCQAIQHAHQKGIIHRDIKPSNVMVTLYDGKPVPKVIDFGVAKATEQTLTERTLFTQFGTMVGTLEYMSPEQAEMSALGVDTRSDIYSLGVLLYELLTGSTPLTHKRMKEAAYAEILRMIKEEEPPKPSTRLSDSGEALASISANRHTEPAKLTKLVRGELDWIVMKCLEKDRNRRYETANGFAADVQRYLDDEQVQACPPSALYRFLKFARRNKAAIGVVGMVLFFLVLLGSGAGWAMRDRSAREAEAARQQADRRAKVAGQVELILTEVERLEREQKWPEALAVARQAEVAVSGGEVDPATAERVGERLKDLAFIDRLEQIRMERATIVDGMLDFSRADREYARAFRDYGVDIDDLPDETSIQRLKARPALAIPLAAALDDWRYFRRVQRPVDAADQKRLKAGWKRLVAVARGIDPEPLRDRLRARFGQPVSKVQDELHRLADSIDIRTQHPATLVELASALQGYELLDSAVLILRKAQLVYPGDFWISFNLASRLYEQKDHEGAVRFYTAAVAIRPTSAVAHNNIAIALRNQAKLEEAVFHYGKAIELAPKYVIAYNNLGIALMDQNKPDDAIASYKKAIELDPKFAPARYNLGNAHMDQNKLPEAVAAYRKAIEVDPKYVYAHHSLGLALRRQNKLNDAIACHKQAIALDPKFAQAHYSLGIALKQKGELDNAIAAYKKAIELDPKYADAHNNLGALLCDNLKDYDQAIECFRNAIKLDPKHRNAHFGLGNALRKQNRLDEAIDCYRKAIELDPDNPDTLRSMSTLAVSYFDAGRTPEALKLNEETLQRRKAKLGPDHPDTLASMVNLANCCREVGRVADAIKLFEEALPVMKAKMPGHRFTFNCMAGLANSYAADGRTPEALQLGEETLKLRKAKLGPDDPDTLSSMNNLARSYYDAGREQEALKLYEETLRLRKAKLGPDHPSTLSSMNNLAYSLATTANVELRDPARAVELATRAVEKSPKAANYRGTLGAARYRAGDWKGSVADLEKAISLYKPDDPNNAITGFFLAMAHWRLGDKNKAREWFDKSVPLIEKGKKDHPELKRFRAEAEELLEIKKQEP